MTSENRAILRRAERLSCLIPLLLLMLIAGALVGAAIVAITFLR